MESTAANSPPLLSTAGLDTPVAQDSERAAESPALVVSLHDVSPHTRETCARVLAELRELGVEQCSLLVVPNHHHQGHLLNDGAFCKWLRQLAEAGHEIVMHGYFHQRPRRRGETLTQRLITGFYTADEGEFYDLGQTDAAALVSKARVEFKHAGLAPSGFIAPAWLLSAEAETALRELGCAYTTRLGRVVDLQTGAMQRSQSLVWSVRSAWRRATSLVWNAVLFRALRGNRLMRISIHPVDRAHDVIWSQIRRLTVRALAGREPLTYERWVARWRSAPTTSPSSVPPL